MVRSSTDELAALRDDVFARDLWRCRWPGCQTHTWVGGSPLQLAHLTHRGMGGSKEANTVDNCVTLCRFHHDVFDGRQGQGKARAEIALMLRAVALADGGVQP